MEIAVAVAAVGAVVTDLVKRVGDFTVNPTVKNCSYYKFNKYIESVRKNVEELEAVADDEEQKANAAKWRGELTGRHNGWWEGEFHKIKSNSVKILKEAEELNNASWKGPFKVFKRVGLSKKAEKLDADIVKLLAHGQKYTGDHGVVPVARLPAVSVHNTDLESRKILMENVLKALQKDENYVVGIWGMVGVGKTMLADEVVARVLEENLFEAAVKVVVSQDMNISEIQSVIVKNLDLTLDETDEVGTARRLQSTLVDGSKILILLDGVGEDEVPLHKVGLPLRGKQKGCKVLVTSQKYRTLWLMEAEETFEVKPLSNYEARQLFKKIAREFPEGDITDNVADECGGLPLAINTVARALGGRDARVWEDALYQLKNSTPPEECKMEEMVYLPIKVSYNLLETQRESQQLLLLCCLFPERADIPIEKLVRYVKGLPLLNISGSLEITSRHVFTLLDNLKNYSFLFSGDKDATVKMNPVVRTVCLNISNKQDKDRLEVMTKLTEWPDHREQQQTYTGMSLAFDDQVQQLHLPDGLHYPTLQLLQLQFRGERLEAPVDFFEAMKKVRVLDLKRITLSGKFIRIEALLPIICILIELRTLCLEFFDLSNEDFSQIGSLNHLEVLSFFCSKIDGLPIQIQQLTNLKLLDLRCFGQLIIPSNVLPGLTRLEELYLGNYDSWLSIGAVQRGKESGISITELSELPLLRVLQIRVKFAKLLLELNNQAWFERLTKFQISAIRKVIKFREYTIGKSITLDGIEWSELLDSKIHKLLKITESLTLKLTTFTNLFGVCSDLKTLDLYKGNAEYIMETGDSVAKLNKLKHIKIKSMDGLIAICEKDLPSESLINLETIKLDNLPKLTCLWSAPLGSGCLVNLRLLDMSYCDAITFVFPFSVAIGLVQLEKLDISCCEKLEWIVSTEEDGIKGVKIVLPKLSYLSLDDLPIFRSFFPNSAVNTPIETGAQVDENPITSDNAANHEKRGCSCFSMTKRRASHTRELIAINAIPLPTSNGVNNQVPQVSGDNVDENINNPLFNKLVELPSMNKLMICSIKNMEHIVDDKTSTESVSNIKIMCVKKCEQLLSLAASEHSIRSLQNLEQVKVELCESMKTLFDFEKCNAENPSTEAILNKLETIVLLDLEKLNDVCGKVPKATCCFVNLKSMDISGCGSLKYIFSVSVAKMLGKLTDLKVRGCATVEVIIEVNGGNTVEEIVEVNGGNTAEEIFEVNGGNMMEEIVEVNGGNTVEEIVEVNGGNNTESDLIVFSCLRVLQLDNLDSISSFSSGNHDFDFPSLQDMLVQKCPTMKIFCRGRVKARQLKQVRAPDLHPYQQVQVKDNDLNQTIMQLHADSENTHRADLVSGEIEEL